VGSAIWSILCGAASRDLSALADILYLLHQMFNGSTLLLDDAFMPATPLINETLQKFASLSDISQGVAKFIKFYLLTGAGMEPSIKPQSVSRAHLVLHL